MMRSPVTLLLLLTAASSSVTHLRYQRSITATHVGPNCVILDPSLYGHATATLADLRLYSGDDPREIPFALLESGSLQAEAEPAQVLNLHQLGKTISFDLQMPARVYTDVTLTLAGQNLLAHATVTAGGASLGDYTLFKLASEHLPDDTTLHLQETAAPVLHLALTPLPGSPPLSPDMVQGATVPPSREAQTLYTAVVSTSTLDQVSHETRAHFTVPAHLPVERVRITLPQGSTPNFSRPVRITSHVAGEPESSGETVRDVLGSVHLTRSGASIDLHRLTAPAILGANLQTAAEVEVAIENGDAPPLPIASISLETRQRQLCFVARSSDPLTLFYGDPQLDPPQYDFARQFRPDPTVHLALPGREQPNPRFEPRRQADFLHRRHPRSTYLGLILATCFVGLFLLRSKKLRI